MTSIVLIVSRSNYIEKVLSSLELQECNPRNVSLLVLVDGDDALYLKVRNLANQSKFEQRLIVRTDYPGTASRYNVQERRRRIAAHHNQAKELIGDKVQYVFSVEDDTTFGPTALKRLLRVADDNRAFAFGEGVELGRWGVPYVGAWKADDIYDPKLLTSVTNKLDVTPDARPENIDAGGLYCALIKADLYKQHTFTSENGLGPDVNFGLECRQLGYENFIDWRIPCTHHYNQGGKELKITPREISRQVQLVKESDVKWRVVT